MIVLYLDPRRGAEPRPDVSLHRRGQLAVTTLAGASVHALTTPIRAALIAALAAGHHRIVAEHRPRLAAPGRIVLALGSRLITSLASTAGAALNGQWDATAWGQQRANGGVPGQPLES